MLGGRNSELSYWKWLKHTETVQFKPVNYKYKCIVYSDYILRYAKLEKQLLNSFWIK